MLKRNSLASPASRGGLVAYQGPDRLQPDHQLLEGPRNSVGASWNVWDWKGPR